MYFFRLLLIIQIKDHDLILQWHLQELVLNSWNLFCVAYNFEIKSLFATVNIHDESLVIDVQLLPSIFFFLIILFFFLFN